MNSIKILMLEDSQLDATVIESILLKNGIGSEIRIVNSGAEYVEVLNRENWDLILCDHQLPDYDSVRALKAKNKKAVNLPFILITGAVPEHEAMELVKEGADDYILKDRLNRLPHAIKKVVDFRQTESEKKSIEQSFSELTQRFHLAAKASFDVIWEYDLKKDVIYCSPSIEKFTGIHNQTFYKPEFLKQFILREDLEALEKSLSWMILSTEHKWRKIFRVVKNDGSIAWVNSNALVIRDEKERVCKIVGVLQDVTEIRKLQHELREQESIKQREIARNTIAAQEKERQEIGKELHDNVNQLLATAKIMIDTARSIPDMREKCLSKSQDSIMDAINELRTISHSLMPPKFGSKSFEIVLHDLIYNLNLSGALNAELEIPGTGAIETLAEDVKLTLYRITQEQISNILKHSNAKNVVISLELTDNKVFLTIADDGKGFDTRKHERGIGFRNMGSRIKMFEGCMKVISSPGEGCVLKVAVSIAKNVQGISN